MRFPREVLAEAGEDAGPVVEQDHSRRARIDAPEVGLQRHPRHLGDGPGQLDARRARAHQHHRQQVAVARGVLLRLRGLVGAQQLGPDGLGVLDRLEPRRERRELVVAEVALLDARGQDKIVVGQGDLAAVGRRRLDVATLRVRAGHLAHRDDGVGLPPYRLTDRDRDVAGRQHRGGHLVEERLEHVVIAPVDQEDLDRRAPEGFHRSETGEAAAHHDHTWSAVSGPDGFRWAHVLLDADLQANAGPAP